ncbi:MAG: hypothetical protein KIT36_25000, partial [Alphaproteobacteria bacterium]|nr:hypothetical protein [Alphaproteobacteria bacterium]
HPVRLAEEIAMLNSLTRGTPHPGIGRGTTKSAYDACPIDMNEARARFAVEICPRYSTAMRRKQAA